MYQKFAAAAALSAGALCFAQVTESVQAMPKGSFEIRTIKVDAMIEGPAKKGAPYSADAVTESVQTLADGTRIVNKSSSKVARDSAGRTRREQTIKGLGPWSSGEKSSSMIFITDSEARVSYVLNQETKTATKTSAAMSAKHLAEAEHYAKSIAGGPSAGVKQERTITVDGGKNITVIENDSPADAGKMVQRQRMIVVNGKEKGYSMEKQGATTANVESLGAKTIEGVMVEGKRTTETVPTGQMGNDRPMVYVNETWTSPELGVIVMSRNVDPILGETTYTLTGIQRSEPDPSLFTVPSDYKREENGTHNVLMFHTESDKSVK